LNNKIVSRKKTSAIFLGILLVAGTIALMSPSFMTNAQAFQMDNNYVKKYHGIDVSVKSIKNTGGLAASFSPPTIAQGTEDLTALEKIEKLKKQWLELLP
jgi:hypothetical protein